MQTQQGLLAAHRISGSRSGSGIIISGKAFQQYQRYANVSGRQHRTGEDPGVKEIQEELIRLGASVYRDEEKAKAEKARARKIAQEYIKEHEGNLITLPEILKEYED